MGTRPQNGRIVPLGRKIGTFTIEFLGRHRAAINLHLAQHALHVLIGVRTATQEHIGDTGEVGRRHRAIGGGTAVGIPELYGTGRRVVADRQHHRFIGSHCGSCAFDDGAAEAHLRFTLLVAQKKFRISAAHHRIASISTQNGGRVNHGKDRKSTIRQRSGPAAEIKPLILLGRRKPSQRASGGGGHIQALKASRAGRGARVEHAARAASARGIESVGGLISPGGYSAARDACRF